MKESCKSCKFSAVENVLLRCRRYPPVYFLENKFAVFPLVRDDEWCGEYLPKDLVKEKLAPK